MRTVTEIRVAKGSPDLKITFDTSETMTVAFGNWEDADKYGVRAEAEKFWTPEAFAAEEAFRQTHAARIAADQASQGA